MDITLAQKFMLEFLPGEAQAPVHEVFEWMKREPIMILNNGLLMTHFQNFKSKDKGLAIAAANGVVLGFALAYCMQDERVQAMMSGFIEQAAKQRGENVINFLHKKGK